MGTDWSQSADMQATLKAMVSKVIKILKGALI